MLDDVPLVDVEGGLRLVVDVVGRRTEPRQRIGGELPAGLQLQHASETRDRRVGLALRFCDFTPGPKRFRRIGVELDRGFDVLASDVGLAVLLVDEGAECKRDGRRGSSSIARLRSAKASSVASAMPFARPRP